SALCLSSTNAGGYLLVANNECDNNKTGLVSNSQNNDDWPSPQIGLCPSGRTGPLGTQSCTVWMNNNIHDNNNPNVPGNGSGLSGQGPVGTGLVLGGSTYVTLYGNAVTHNGAWGEVIADLPDQEAPAPNNPNPCQGGMCRQANAGDQTVLAAQLECDGQFFGPCPSGTVANYPRPQTPFPTSTSPPALPPVPSSLQSMPDPCSGVPKNPWCH